MADRIGGVYVEIGAMMDGFNRAINEARVKSGNLDRQLNDNVTRTSSAFSGMGKTIVGVSALIGAALGAMYVKMARQAMDAVETQQKFSVVFKDTLEAANAAVTNLADNYGLATTEARDMLSATGDLLAGFGMTGEQALQLSERTQQLAVDLASFTNYSGGARGASDALTKAMLGEREMLKSLGIVIRESDIKQRLASMGMANATGVARMQAQAQATLALAYEQSTNAIGDFARSADSPANVMRVIKSRLQDISEQIGDKMLPGLRDLGLSFIEASKDGGVLITAGKAIGTILSKVAQAMAIIIRMSNEISMGSRMQVQTQLMDAAARTARSSMGQLTNVMSRVRAEGLSSAGGLRQMTTDLENLSRGQGRNATMARGYLQEIKGWQENINRAQARQNELMTGTNRLTTSIVDNRRETDNLIDSIRGVSNNTEELAAQRARDRQRTQEQTTATGDQTDALKKLKQARDGILEGLRTSEMSEVEQVQDAANKKKQILERALAADIGTREQYNQAVIQLERQTAQQVEEIRQKEQQQTATYAMTILSTVGGMVSQLGNLFSMYYSNKQAEVDNNLQVETDALDAKYANDQTRINSEITDSAAKAAALKALDEKYARDKKALEDKAAKDKAKLEREAAKRQKALAVADVLITTPAAAMQAFRAIVMPRMPWTYPLGIAAAAATTALGLAKLKLIMDTPLPAAASGIYAESPYIGGEAGPELAFPLSSERGRAALSLFSEQFINKLGEGSATKAPEATIGNSAGNMFRVVVNLGSKVLYDDITEATANGEIMVHARAIV